MNLSVARAQERQPLLFAVTLFVASLSSACSSVTERRAKSVETTASHDLPAYREPSHDTIRIRYELDGGRLTLAIQRVLHCTKARQLERVETVTTERELGPMVYVEEAVAVGALLATAIWVGELTSDCVPGSFCGIDAIPVLMGGGAVVAAASGATAVDWIRGIDSSESTRRTDTVGRDTVCGSEAGEGPVVIRLPNGRQLEAPLDRDGLAHFDFGAEVQRYGDQFTIGVLYRGAEVKRIAVQRPAP